MLRPPNHQDVIAIGGPTASGKSALALSLAERVGGSVINADSMQVYRELRVLTARPEANDAARVPHRLYGHVPARERYSADRYQAEACAAMAEVAAEGRVPILVGGTGLYFRAVMEGFSPLPDISADARAAAAADLARLGPSGLYQRLAAVDPVTAARLAPADRQRIQRAWEVWLASGKPMSAWHAEPVHDGRPAFRFTVVRMLPDRAALYDRCDKRLEAMIRQGALDEVSSLITQGLSPTLPAMKALGVAPLAAALAGQISHAQAVATAQQQTRNYAKRQFTWFRNQWPPTGDRVTLHACHDHNEQQSEDSMRRLDNIIRSLR